jgi:hypothetical protein
VSCTIRSAQDSVGAITVLSLQVDGVTFTISDGISQPVTFELDTDGVCTAGPNKKCLIVGTVAAPPGTTAEIAQSIRSGVPQWGLKIKTTNRSDSVVELSNSEAGISGNNPIQVSAEDVLGHAGMQGGTGCKVGLACNTNDDCAGTAVCSGSGWNKYCVSQ